MLFIGVYSTDLCNKLKASHIGLRNFPAQDVLEQDKYDISCKNASWTLMLQFFRNLTNINIVLAPYLPSSYCKDCNKDISI